MNNLNLGSEIEFKEVWLKSKCRKSLTHLPLYGNILAISVYIQIWLFEFSQYDKDNFFLNKLIYKWGRDDNVYRTFKHESVGTEITLQL